MQSQKILTEQNNKVTQINYYFYILQAELNNLAQQASTASSHDLHSRLIRGYSVKYNFDTKNSKTLPIGYWSFEIIIDLHIFPKSDKNLDLAAKIIDKISPTLSTNALTLDSPSDSIKLLYKMDTIFLTYCKNKGHIQLSDGVFTNVELSYLAIMKEGDEALSRINSEFNPLENFLKNTISQE